MPHPRRMPRAAVVVFDWNVSETSPAGSLIRKQLIGLSGEFQFTVVACRFENPRPDEIGFVRIPLPLSPEILTDALYPHVAMCAYRRWRRHRPGVVIQQGTGGQRLAPDIVYAHFCHRTFLGRHWHYGAPRGLHKITSWLFHELNASRERRAFAKARLIVVPSEGLRQDIVTAYPDTKTKIRIVHNPVDLTHFTKPAEFVADSVRAQYSLDANDLVLVFVAKAGFGRKGLKPLISALAAVPSRRLKLLIVGGTEREREEARRQAKVLGLGERVVLTGLLSDVRPALWCGDIYAAPSTYEAFSLAALEAAAAGLPLLATPVSGMDEILSPQTGWEVECTVDSIASALSVIVDTPRSTIRDRGVQARRAVEIYDLASFVGGWRTCLLELAANSSGRGETVIATSSG